MDYVINVMKTKILAALIILSALTLAIFSVKNDSVTTDESPHITAGYSYLTQKDMRLNPEHPPLIKDLAAVPLLFQKINFDTNHYSWKTDINGQWSAGSHFLYESGNNPDTIAGAARLAILIIFALLCLMVFKWARARYGDNTALFVLTLTALSPNILAQARYVTTDIGASLAFITAAYFFVKQIKNPSGKNIFYAGLAFGLAQLLKFSLILLLPMFFIIITALAWSEYNHRLKIFWNHFKRLLAVVIIGYLLVWPVYQFHVWNYPPERQKSDTEFILASFPLRPVADLTVWMADQPLLRPYAQYMLGLLMVFQRTGGGNTTYFMGEISATAWKSYFPTIYILKEPIPALIFLAIAFALVINGLFRRNQNNLKKWIKNHIDELTWVVIIGIYWASSISGNLNIGLRHVLPTFPFIYLLISGKIAQWIKPEGQRFPSPIKLSLVAILALWYVIESLLTFPHYLAYFNELAGGPANGYKYAADSNLDWGQDLKRLKDFVEKNKIEKIKVDYFGGGSPQYYLGDKYEKLDANNSDQRHGWIAVSATLLQGGRGQAAKGYDRDTTYYNWLNQYQPVTQIGYSIFVYKLE